MTKASAMFRQSGKTNFRIKRLIPELYVVFTLVFLTAAEYIDPATLYNCPPSHHIYPCSCNSATEQGLQLTCSNTNLASLAVALSNVADLNRPIVRLNISSSRFTRLYGDLLYALEVNELIIQDTPITEIEPLSFRGINKTLTNLKLIHTNLLNFPTDAFKDLGKMTELYIDGHNITSLAKGSIVGLITASLQKFTLSNGELKELSPDVLGVCKNLKRVDLHGNKLTALQRNQFKDLRNLDFLDISYNEIVKVDSPMIGDLIKLSWFNISHNAIKDIGRGAFGRNTVLRSLNLSHNKLKKLDANSLKGIRFIRRLYLSDNEIPEVPRGAFEGMKRIGTIDLARNKLTKISFQMFSGFQYVEIIDVSDNQITEIEKKAFTDLYLVHINISHNSINKIEPGAFINCANMTTLDLSYNNISSIPAKVFDEISYASILELSYNQLTDISKIPFGNMTGLKILNITHNKLSGIPKGTFPKLYELHTIDLSHNNIASMYRGSFHDMNGLRYLNLSHNSLVELHTSDIGTVPTMLSLDLSHNNLQKIAKSALTKLTALQILDLSHNNLSGLFEIPLIISDLDLSFNSLTTIDPSTWPTMNALLRLNLSNNYLEDSLQGGAFAHLLSLQKLDLSSNYISYPPWESLGDLTSLQYLYIQKNNLTTLGKGAFGRLPILFQLNLSENQLQNISTKAFDGLLQLIKLDLSHNEINLIQQSAFSGLVSLTTLDLSHNKISSLDNKTHGLFDETLSLETLYLNNNKIAFVTRKMFPNSPHTPYKLRHVDFSYNTMSALTKDITYGTRTVQYLNLSHNFISEIRGGVIGNLSSLRSLDLSHNKLIDINEEESFHSPPGLSELYLSNNELTTIPINKLLRLKTLDVRNNQLNYYEEMTSMVKNGSDISFEGNHMDCDCRLRPLRRFLREDNHDKGSWGDVRCMLPQSIAGLGILELDEEALSCPGEVDDDDFDTTPDLRFRELNRANNGKLMLTWYVTSKDDIADFDLIIRDVKNPENGVIMKRHFSYSTRKVAFSRLPSSSKAELEVCVVGVNSKGEEREAHRLQCSALPSSSLTLQSSLIIVTCITLLQLIIQR